MNEQIGFDMFKTEVTLSDSGFLFDHSTGLTYSLNPTGQFIFLKLQSGLEPEKIITLITEEFAVDEITARKDMDDFYRLLKEMGIVE